MADQHARVHLDRRRQVAGRGPGEDLDRDAGVGQPLGRLDHVDVQAAGVAAAGRVQRRGVHRQHRHPAGPGEPAAAATPYLDHARFPLSRGSRRAVRASAAIMSHRRSSSAAENRGRHNRPVTTRPGDCGRDRGEQRHRRGHRPPAGGRGLRGRRRRPPPRPARRAGRRDARASGPSPSTSPTRPRSPRWPPQLDDVAVLVNNAGGALGVEPIERADPADWQAMFDTQRARRAAGDPGAAAGARARRRRPRRGHRLDRRAPGLRGRRPATSRPSTAPP